RATAPSPGCRRSWRGVRSCAPRVRKSPAWRGRIPTRVAREGDHPSRTMADEERNLEVPSFRLAIPVPPCGVGNPVLLPERFQTLALARPRERVQPGIDHEPRGLIGAALAQKTDGSSSWTTRGS